MISLPSQIDITTLSGTNGVEGLVDMRYFPLTMEKKLGDPSEEYVHNFYKWRKACSAVAARNNTFHVNIMDICDWGVPKPTIRRLIGEYSAADKDEEGFAWQFIIVDKPVIRGAVTAIVWMRGDNSVFSFVANWQEAVRNAIAEFDKRGLPTPKVDPATYKMPEDEAARRRR